MARPYRLQAEDCFYHITSRGDDRKKIFLSETDHKKFFEYLKTAKERFKFYLHSYCLMGNHYHLFLETPQPNLSRIMQYINTAYTSYYNVKRNKKGHLFQGRYKSILVEESAYFAELTRYIHLNPVRAKIVSYPYDYQWSSYKAYIQGKDDGLVDLDRVKQFLDMDFSQYSKFVEDAKDYPDPCKNAYAGFILGSVKFIKDKLSLLKDDVESDDFSHKRAVKNIIEPKEVVNAVAAYFKSDPEQMCKSKKRPMTARKAALYLLRRKTGLTNAQIGELFGMKLAAVSKSALSFERQMAKDRKLKLAIEQISSKVEV